MTPDSYGVRDRRRVTLTGVNRPPRPPGLPAVPYSRYRAAVDGAWRHIRTHLERDLRTDRLRPPARWVHAWGLALSSRQTFRAATILVSDRLHPETLPLQAAILVRSLLEALGNIMALTSSPTAPKWFVADGYRSQFERQQLLESRYRDQQRWTTWLAQMADLLRADAKFAKLSKRRTANPTKTIQPWPSPYWLTHPRRVRGRKRPLAVLLKGNRARLFNEAYHLWYAELSSYAHQRRDAAKTAIFSDDPASHWEPGRLESNVASEALIFFACILSELEAAAGMPPAPDLRALWALLWDLDEHAKEFVRIRYRRLLHLPELTAL